MKNPIKEYISAKDGTITYYFSINFGKPFNFPKPIVTKFRGHKTRKEAKAAYALIKSRAAQGIFPETVMRKINKHLNLTITSETTLNVYFETFWKSYVSKGNELTTNDKTEGYFKNHILPYFGEMSLNKITPLICREFANKLQEKIASSSRQVLVYLNMILQDAVKMDVIEKNPMQHVDTPTNSKVKKNKKIAGEEDVFFSNYYKVDELMAFLSFTKVHVAQKKHTFFLLLAHCGLRRGEAFALRWSDIDFEKKLIHVTKSVAYAKSAGTYLKSTKNHESRKITIDHDTLDELASWKNAQQKELAFIGSHVKSDYEQHIFANTKNNVQNPNAATRWLDSIYASTNLRPITSHGFRHTHCTLALQSRMFTIEQVMHRLGHKDIKVTMDVYRHVTVEEMENNADMYVGYLRSIVRD